MPPLKRAVVRMVGFEAAIIAASMATLLVPLVLWGLGLVEFRNFATYAFEPARSPAELQTLAESVVALEPRIDASVTTLDSGESALTLGSAQLGLDELANSGPVPQQLRAQGGRSFEMRFNVPRWHDGRPLEPSALGGPMLLSAALAMLVVARVLFRRFPVSAPAPVPLGAGAALAWLLGTVGMMAGVAMLASVLTPPERIAENRLAIEHIASSVWGITAVIVAFPLAEELVYRRWLYRGLVDDGLKLAGLAQAALFAIPHLWLGWQGMLVALAIGWGLSVVYQRTGRLWIPLVAHVGFNALSVVGVLLATRSAT